MTDDAYLIEEFKSDREINIERAEELISNMERSKPAERDINAMNEMIKTLQDLQNDGITDEEISRALTLLIHYRDEAVLAQEATV